MPSLREEIFLIGYPKHQLVGCKLPSKGDCLKVFFYNMRTTKLIAKDSAALVVRECVIFWEKARIPVQQLHRGAKKLLSLYEEWKDLKKNKSRVSEIHKKRRVQWEDSLDDLFDIAHSDALELINIEEDKQFLIKQRMKGREGSMLGLDLNFKGKEERKMKRKKQEELRKELSVELPSTSSGKNFVLKNLFFSLNFTLC